MTVFFSFFFIEAIWETDVNTEKKVFLRSFLLLLKFPVHSRTRYFIEQTKLPEVVKFYTKRSNASNRKPA